MTRRWRSDEQAIKLEPTFLEGHIIRGNLLTALGRDADALASYDRALALAPAEVSVLTRRADCAGGAQASGRGAGKPGPALAIAPSDVDVLSNRGFLLQSLNRYDEALATVDRALAINPGHGAALVNRGALLSELSRYAEALATFDRALAASPSDVRLHCNRAKTLFGLKSRQGGVWPASTAHSRSIRPTLNRWYTRGMLLPGSADTARRSPL